MFLFVRISGQWGHPRWVSKLPRASAHREPCMERAKEIGRMLIAGAPHSQDIVLGIIKDGPSPRILWCAIPSVLVPIVFNNSSSRAYNHYYYYFLGRQNFHQHRRHIKGHSQCLIGSCRSHTGLSHRCRKGIMGWNTRSGMSHKSLNRPKI